MIIPAGLISIFILIWLAVNSNYSEDYVLLIIVFYFFM